jgi:hypothetical protein
MKTRTKRILISVLVAFLLVIGSFGWLFVTTQTANSDGQDAFTQCLMIFYAIGVFCSGNAEDPSGVAICLSMFLFFFALTYSALIFLAYVRKHSHDT